LDAKLTCLVELRASSGSCDDDIGLRRHRTGNLGSKALCPRLGLVTRKLLQRTGEDDGLAGNRAVGSRDLFCRQGCAVVQFGKQPRDDLDIARLLVEFDDGARHDLPDAFNRVEVVPGIAGQGRSILHRCLEIGVGAVGARQKLRRGLSDVADTEGIDEPMQRNAASLVDCRIELSDADPAEAFDVFKLGQRVRLPLLQSENIGRSADLQGRIVALKEEVDLLRPQALDIEGIAGDEVLQMLGCLCTADETAGASGN